MSDIISCKIKMGLRPVGSFKFRVSKFVINFAFIFSQLEVPIPKFNFVTNGKFLLRILILWVSEWMRLFLLCKYFGRIRFCKTVSVCSYLPWKQWTTPVPVFTKDCLCSYLSWKQSTKSVPVFTKNCVCSLNTIQRCIASFTDLLTQTYTRILKILTLNVFHRYFSNFNLRRTIGFKCCEVTHSIN